MGEYLKSISGRWIGLSSVLTADLRSQVRPINLPSFLFFADIFVVFMHYGVLLRSAQSLDAPGAPQSERVKGE